MKLALSITIYNHLKLPNRKKLESAKVLPSTRSVVWIKQRFVKKCQPQCLNPLIFTSVGLRTHYKAAANLVIPYSVSYRSNKLLVGRQFTLSPASGLVWRSYYPQLSRLVYLYGCNLRFLNVLQRALVWTVIASRPSLSYTPRIVPISSPTSKSPYLRLNP